MGLIGPLCVFSSGGWVRMGGGGVMAGRVIDQGRGRQVQEYTCLTGQWQEQLDLPPPWGFDNMASEGQGMQRGWGLWGPRHTQQTPSF